jgi:OmpA-OmpF porin, OOP family
MFGTGAGTGLRPGAAGPVAAVLVAGGLAALLTGCGSKDVDVTGPGGTSALAASSSRPGAAAEPSASTDGRFVFPDLPQIVVPDVTSFTERSQRYAEKLGDVAAPGAGVTVAGARCDTQGRVINNATMTLTDHGDGSGSYDDAYKTVVNDGKGAGVYDDAYKRIEIKGDGSGVYDDAYKRIEINADGSGFYDDAYKRIEINADGSGFYDDAYVRINVNADGSGDLDDAYKTIKVAADGSGTYHDASIDVTVDADGSGRYEDASTTVTSNGDGTGTIDGEPAKVAPFPLFPPVGRFPPVKALKPLGRSCGTLIRLDDRVLFDFDQDTLRPEAGPVLDKVAEALAGLGVPLQVNGHTDARGEASYNLDLSQRRAQAVADALAARGVDTALTVKGFGETRPVAPNTIDGKDDPAGRQRNRRVEIVVPQG